MTQDRGLLVSARQTQPQKGVLQMIGKKRLLWVAVITMVLLLVAVVGAVQAQGLDLTPQEELGKNLFFDTNLSDSARAVLRRLPRPGGRAGPARTRPSMPAGPSTKEPSPAASATASRLQPPMPATARSCTGTARMGGRHVLGRPRHRLDPRRSPGRTGTGSVPEPAGAEQRQRAGRDRQSAGFELQGPVPSGLHRPRHVLRVHRPRDRRLRAIQRKSASSPPSTTTG